MLLLAVKNSLGRVDNDEAGYYRHLLRMHGVDVRYVSENFNGDATDDLLRPVKQWQARQESKDLSKVTIRGLLSKMQDANPGAPGPMPPDLTYRFATLAACSISSHVSCRVVVPLNRLAISPQRRAASGESSSFDSFRATAGPRKAIGRSLAPTPRRLMRFALSGWS